MVYATLLVVAVLLVPVVRAVSLWLADQRVVAAMSGESASLAVEAIVVVVGATALLVRRLGPVVLTPFEAAALGTGAVAPGPAWRGAALRAQLAVTLVLAAAAALVVSGSVVAGMPLLRALAFVVGAALVSAQVGLLWLVGALASRRALAVVAIGAVAAVVGQTAFATPVLPSALLASVWPGAGEASVLGPLVALGIWSAASLTIASRLLPRLGPQTVLDHALRWEAISILARSGDPAGAADRLRALPSWGRRWRLSFGGPPPIAVLRRALPAPWRTPLRATFALTALVTSGAMWALVPISGAASSLVAVAIGLIGLAASGGFSDGLREAADTASRPPLVPQSPFRLLALHLAPAALPIVVAPALAATVTVLIGGPATTLSLSVAAGVLWLAVRAYDAARGPLPLALLAPVPTAAGDLSGAMVLLWQLDAVLITALGSTWFSTLGPFAPPAAIGMAVPLLLLAGRRLHRMAS